MFSQALWEKRAFRFGLVVGVLFALTFSLLAAINIYDAVQIERHLETLSTRGLSEDRIWEVQLQYARESFQKDDYYDSARRHGAIAALFLFLPWLAQAVIKAAGYVWRVPE